MSKSIKQLCKTFNIDEKTPSAFYDRLNNEFDFDFDPCPLNSKIDGLSIDWGKRVYVNPPYGKYIPIWLNKAINEIKKGNSELIVFLIPSYTDVKWFHEIVLPLSYEIRFIKGRLKFGDHNNTAPFASMVVIFK